jgi:hypothetical protein
MKTRSQMLNEDAEMKWKRKLKNLEKKTEEVVDKMVSSCIIDNMFREYTEAMIFEHFKKLL